MVYLGPAITDDRLEVFEKRIGFALPVDFKYIFGQHNGLSLEGTEVYCLDKELRGSSLDNVCYYEHFEVYNPMPTNFVPFSPDGRGNHYCLELSTNSAETCPVVFWQHDFEYDAIEDVERCNTSFVDWINDVMISWKLEDFNYDGTEK
jgi:cell wall assembly regulator SMI1